MSKLVGQMVVRGKLVGVWATLTYNGLSVSAFSGPKGALGVQLTPSAVPIDYLQLNEEQVRELIALLQEALK